MTGAGDSPNAAGRSLFVDYRLTRDHRLRDRLFEAHRDIAEFFVRRYSGRGVPVDDLRQVAHLTLVRAIERFDPEQNVEFSTFAGRTIEGELKRYFRDRTWTVRPPRRAQELHLAVRRTAEELSQRFGRLPSVHEIAAELAEPLEAVLDAIEVGLAHNTASFDQPDAGDERPSVVREGEVMAHADPGFEQVDRRLVVQELLDHLSDRDRIVLELRFFDNLTQEEIAGRLGISQSYLSRILRRVLIDLRDDVVDRMADDDIDDVVGFED